ncbi:MAG: glycine cleavage system protein GcvH [Proteobacteria bacterium]|nr:glycine cleavage system protein GcvH [Pseudomonadota bacterium]
MSNVPSELRYSDTHEWARLEDDGTIVIGITDHAQHLLGDLVFVELPDEGIELKGGDEAGVVESVKAASDFYSPITGEVVEVNEELQDSPALVNTDPYGDGWLFRIQPEDTSEFDALLDADAYNEQISEEE